LVILLVIVKESEGAMKEEMTANELADAIEKGGKDGFFQDEIIAILRQQQAEIEALKQHWSEPQTDLIVLLREEVTLMQKYLEEQNLREHFVTWRNEK
jgi:erythromycin esterase-like protein